MIAVSKSIESILLKGERIIRQRGDILSEQYARPDNLYLLLEGMVIFYYDIASMEQELIIGKASFEYAPVGLNIFNKPYRSESTAKIGSETATLLRFDKDILLSILEEDKEAAIELLYFLNTKAHQLIAESSELFAETHIISKSFDEVKDNATGYKSFIEQDELETVIFLLQSPFMEVFEEDELVELTRLIVRKQFNSGDVINKQGMHADGINILEQGEVQFSRINKRKTNEYQVHFRSISTPGYLLGSANILSRKSLFTSTVSKDSVVLHIPGESLKACCENNLDFALKLQLRILWLINNQIRAVRARLVSAKFDEELVAVTSLIDNNRVKLHIHSQIHLVPHLLKDKLTINQGLDILHQLEAHGKAAEKNLASLCLDNLHNTQKEVQFYDGLINLYDTVTEAPKDEGPSIVQKKCILSTKQAFSPASVMLRGYEHLPEEPGHIFIYNHLLNDPYYTLPNEFQITLDSHFLSALIYEKYGDLGQRIVRVGRNIEYGHQN